MGIPALIKTEPIVWLLSQPLFWAVLAVVLGPIFFWRGFRLLQRARFMMDIPRSTARAAALGTVELSGKATGPYTLVSPLSQTDCLYYRVIIKSDSKGNLRNKMRELSAPLFLDDGTGKLMIYPVGAELQLQATSGSPEYGSLRLAVPGSPPERPELAEEYCIKPGDDIFVLGTLQENPWAKKDPAEECDELSRIGPGFVSQDEADILQHEAFPALDPRLPAGPAPPANQHYDFHPPVLLMKGEGPFVISSQSQRNLVTKLYWKSIAYTWGGPAATLWGLWEILVRSGGSLSIPLK